MAYSGNQVGAPGLLFPLWGKKGEPGKVYAAKPESNGILLGIAQRTTVCDGYDVGDAVNVVKKGRVWVKVKGEVMAGQPAYVDNDSGLPTAATAGTAITGGYFKSNAKDGELAELEIA